MFSKHQGSALADLSNDLRDESDWHPGSLKTIDLLVNITALAAEPVSGMLAIGTADGFIHLFGKPGVQCKVSLPEPAAVRLLQFSTFTFSVVCLDANNQFHAFSLLELGKPKLLASARFDPTNSITTSPSHSHVFLGANNGDVKTYDVTCKRKSPYTIPNLWKLYEEKMIASGMPSLTPPAPANVVDVVIHPRNLDLVFVVYTGGIILTDLTQRSSIRAYELILPPGAPGGTGYGGPDLLTHRRAQVSSMSIHPSGHFFAAGYEDGSIAFWAVEDDNKPLLVRTLDELDVNLVHGEHLERHLSSPTEQHGPLHIKEPIFKLSWSSYTDSTDPRGGDTTLAILGGLDERKPPGLSVFLLPAFNPSEPSSDQPVPKEKELHSHFREAMRQSLTPKKTFFYETRGIVQDYLLLPRTTPHLGGNFDPYAVLIVEEINGARVVNAWQYPRAGFIRASPSSTLIAEANDDNEVEAEAAPLEGLASPPVSASSSKSSRLSDTFPAQLRTPVSVSAGATGILGGQLLRLEKDVYHRLIAEGSSNDHHLNLRGGQAYAETTSEAKLLKYQPHRVLITYHQDCSVRFFDVSQQLLLPDPSANDMLERDWPEALPGLTIELEELFDDIVFTGMVMTQVNRIAISSVHFAPEGLECAVVLASGEVVVYHQLSSRSDAPSLALSKEIVPLGHIAPSPGQKMVPYFMLAPGKGAVESCAMSDVGFLAASYKDGALLIVDMRGPKTIFSTGQAKRQRQSVFPIHPGQASVDSITSLTWTVSPLESDRHLSVRLIAARQSGTVHVYTLVHSANQTSWSIAGDPVELKSVADPLPSGTFVLDKKSGAQWKADRSRFAAVFKGGMSPVITATGGSASNECFMLVVGAKGARTAANITGDRIGKADWGARAGNVQAAQVVEHMGSKALVLQTDRHTALVYSLPHLEHISTLQIPTTSALPLAIDESGDYIAWTPFTGTHSQSQSATEVMQSATYGTFFDQRRSNLPPDIDFASTRGTVPAQPQPVSLGPASILGSWFTYNQTLTGAQVDELLGGPDRPVPKAPAPARSASGDVAGTVGSAAAGIAAGAAAGTTSMYTRLTSAMSERGQILGDLEERFNSLEEGSRNMVAQAKRLAAQQTAKGWFGF